MGEQVSSRITTDLSEFVFPVVGRSCHESNRKLSRVSMPAWMQTRQGFVSQQFSIEWRHPLPHKDELLSSESRRIDIPVTNYCTRCQRS
jgi:hypothetical protein